MKKVEKAPANVAELRARAEARLKEDARRSEDAGHDRLEKSQRLVHELQVHQIELELQNEELQQTRADLEAGLKRYALPIAFSFSTTRSRAASRRVGPRR
jgi:hypothetical protein